MQPHSARQDGIVWPIGDFTTDVLCYGTDAFVIIDTQFHGCQEGWYRRDAHFPLLTRTAVSLFFRDLRADSSTAACLRHSAMNFHFEIPSAIASEVVKFPAHGDFNNTRSITHVVVKTLYQGAVVMPKSWGAVYRSLLANPHLAQMQLGFLEDSFSICAFRQLVSKGHKCQMDKGVLVHSDAFFKQVGAHFVDIFTRFLAVARRRTWSLNQVVAGGELFRFSPAFGQFVNDVSSRPARPTKNLKRVFAESSTELSSSERVLLHSKFSAAASSTDVPRTAAQGVVVVPCIARQMSQHPHKRSDNEVRWRLAQLLVMIGARIDAPTRSIIDYTRFYAQAGMTKARIAHFEMHERKRYAYPAKRCCSMTRNTGERGLMCTSTPSACGRLNNVDVLDDTSATPISVMFGLP